MRRKVFRTMVWIAIMSLLVSEGLMLVQMLRVDDLIIQGNEESGAMLQDLSSAAMTGQMTESLGKLAENKAEYANDKMESFASAVESLAGQATNILSYPGRYKPDALNELGPLDMGSTICLAAYADGVDPNDPAVADDLALLCNLREAMVTVNDSFPAMSTNYIAMENGLYLGTEAMKEEYYSDRNEVLRFNSFERPWYVEPMEAGTGTFTKIFADVDTGRATISYGAPIYRKDKIAGVCAAGIYLDDIEKAVTTGTIGNEGFSFIVNGDGQVIFHSTSSSISDSTFDEGTDLLQTDNEDLKVLVAGAIAGGKNVGTAVIGNSECLIAYAPMSSVNWSFMMAVPLEEMLTPVYRLSASMEFEYENESKTVDGILQSTYVIMLLTVIGVGILVAVFALRLSKTLVEPIVLLTDEVKKVEGDKLDFDLKLETNDEVQTLAEAFGSLTLRMKEYIKDITAITAEKERIGAELSVATQIQADMLPTTFPRQDEFEIYAVMDPAKEVGGDFYDFFMLDESHLVTVIADVSGKGVPAALFMVISKTLIKSQAMNDNSPAGIMEAVNNQLCENNKASMFVTAWIGIMDIHTGEMVCASAGHEFPAIRGTDGEFALLKDDHGLVLAAMEGVPFSEYKITIPDNGTIFVYTDGVPEATNKDDQLYEMDRMIAALNQEPDADPQTLLRNVRADIDCFVGDAPQFDDLTMLCVKRRKKKNDPE